MAEPYRLLFVTGEYPPLVGGIADYTQRLAHALAAQGVQVDVLTSVRARGAGRLEGDRAEAAGPRAAIDVERLHGPARDALAGSAPVTGSEPAQPIVPGQGTSRVRVHPIVRWWTVPALPWLIEQIERRRPDAVHIQYQPAAFDLHGGVHLLPGVLSLKRIPTIVTFHDLRIPYLFPKAGPVRELANCTLARTASAVITTNDEDRHAILDWGLPSPQVFAIPLGQNLPPIEPVAALSSAQSPTAQALGSPSAHPVSPSRDAVIPSPDAVSPSADPDAPPSHPVSASRQPGIPSLHPAVPSVQAVIPSEARNPEPEATPAVERARPPASSEREPAAAVPLKEATARVGFFGLVNRSKGLETLIEAVARLRDEGRPLRLDVIGGGAGSSDAANAAYLEQVQAEVQRVGLASAVRFVAPPDEAALTAALRACTVLALPFDDGASLRRTSLLTALAHGVATITTTGGSPGALTATGLGPETRFQLDDEVASFVPPGDATALAGAIRRLLDDPARRAALAQHGVAATQRLRWDAIAAAHRVVYEWVSSRRR